MQQNNFIPKKPCLFAKYGRMSAPGQNAHSVDQQFDTIDRVLKQLRLPWLRLANIRGDAISGQYNSWPG